MQRAPGPLCASSLSKDWIDEGTLIRTRSDVTRPQGTEALTASERETLLDLTQMALDLAGVVDPTPVADGTNLVISLGRGDWLGAGLSGLSLIPFIGDLAKTGKLGRWAETVHKAVSLASSNARFAEKVRPILSSINDILKNFPEKYVPEAAKSAFKKIKIDISSITIKPLSISRIHTIENYLRNWYKYIDDLHIPSPGRDRGVLWSRLDQGADEAARLAGFSKTTLEQSLGPSKFIEKYELAVAQLIEKFGDSDEAKKFIWDNFGRNVWLKASQKYASSLEGQIIAHVRIGGARGLGSKSGIEAIIWDELFEIAEIMEKNQKITSVLLKDAISGEARVMLRSEVLRATRLSQ